MAILEKINVELASISDIKKSPMKAFEKAKNQHRPIYVLNNSKEVGVILSINEFHDLIDMATKGYEYEQEQEELKFQETVDNRIQNDTGKRKTNEEVMGDDWRDGLEDMIDEWE